MELKDPLFKTVTVTAAFSPDIQADVDYYEHISTSIRLYVTPLIIFGGTVGNILTITVVLSRHFRYIPSRVLLLALAIVDTGVLYTNLLDVWLGALLGGDSLQFIREQGTFGCKFSLFMTYFLTHSSSWILVLINIDRLIAVYHPLQAHSWCTRKRLGIALLIMFVILAAISVHVFWTITYFEEADVYKCQFDMEVLGDNGEITWLIVDAIIFTFAPFIIILSCNVAIIIALLRGQQNRKSTMNVRTSKSNDSTTSVTLMLITVSIVFLVTTSPLTICYQFYDSIMAKYENDPVGKALYYEMLINTFLVLLCYSNNAVNFMLYCISGSKFRKALADICCNRKCRKYAMPSRTSVYTLSMSLTQSTSPKLHSLRHHRPHAINNS